MPASGRRWATKRGKLSLEHPHPLLKGFHPAAQGQNLFDDHVLGLVHPALDRAEPALAGAPLGLLRESLSGGTWERAEKNGGNQRHSHDGLAPFRPLGCGSSTIPLPS